MLKYLLQFDSQAGIQQLTGLKKKTTRNAMKRNSMFLVKLVKSPKGLGGPYIGCFTKFL